MKKDYWTYDKWITELDYLEEDFTEISLKEARDLLFNRVIKLDGVKLIGLNKGIKIISVTSKSGKSYMYEIRAKYTQIRTGKTEFKKQGIFSNELKEVPIYKKAYVGEFIKYKC